MGNVNRREFPTLVAGGAVAATMPSGVDEPGSARRENAPERPNILGGNLERLLVYSPALHPWSIRRIIHQD